MRAPLTAVGAAFFRDDDGAVAVAHARAVRQQRVLVDQVRVGVKRNRRDLVASLERGAVQRLDIRQDLIDDDAPGFHVPARQPEKHERIVGIGTVGNGDSCFLHSYQLSAISFQFPAFGSQLMADS